MPKNKLYYVTGVTQGVHRALFAIAHKKKEARQMFMDEFAGNSATIINAERIKLDKTGLLKQIVKEVYKS